MPYLLLMADFFRIEHFQSRKGPYMHNDNVYYDVLSEFDWTERVPSPFEEGLWPDKWAETDKQYRVRIQQVCGFATMEQATTWFSPDILERIVNISDEYLFVHFTVKPSYMKVGKRQAVAYRDFLKTVNEISLEEHLTRVLSMTTVSNYETLSPSRTEHDDAQRIEFMPL